MRVSEIYRSRQGEGFLTGTESVFVRTSGCNLRCWFCDTPYASWQPEGDDWSVDEIVAEVIRLSDNERQGHVSHVVITGGEPFLWSEMVSLTQALRRSGRHITLETAGTLMLDVACDLMSISPKRPNSAPLAVEHARWHARHEERREAPGVLRQLVERYAYQVKFVVDTPADCDDVEQFLREVPEIARDRVMLMPQGVAAAALAERQRWLEPYCRENGLRFCPRQQIAWYGNRRGT